MNLEFSIDVAKVEYFGAIGSDEKYPSRFRETCNNEVKFESEIKSKLISTADICALQFTNDVEKDLV